jgi:hypothetical protein
VAAESTWQLREMAFFEELLANGRFDVLVVPFQVEQDALDRPTRLIAELHVQRRTPEDAPARAAELRAMAETVAGWGAGPLRVHDGAAAGAAYPPPSAGDWHAQPAGIDLLLDRALIRRHFPYVAADTVALLHARRCGWLSGQQLGMHLLELARRHAILRTTYMQDGPDVWQVVHEPAPVFATRVDLSDMDDARRAARAEELVRAELHTPFDLRRLPLMRWTVLILGPAEYELVLVEHHLVHDGWSFALLMRELKALYNAYAEGLASPLPEPTAQYHDFATWQHDELLRGADGVLAAQVEHWRNRLSGMPAPLTLHPDRPRPTVQTYRGETLRIELPPQLPAAIRAFCRGHRVTLFSAMYAAFVALLHRYTGEDDVCIGSAYANRQLPGTHDLVGMFVNAVVLRCDVTGATSFADLAVRARDVVLDAAAHQELPFTDLVRELNPHRDAAAQPLTHVLFSVNDSPLPELDLAGATGTIFERGNGSAKTDLDVVVIPRAESQTADAGQIDDRILLLWEYNRDLFDESTMRAMAERYLWSPIRLGPVTVRNRIVFSAHLTNYADDGLPTEQHAAYYAARAAGGAGLIITEEHSTHPTDWPYEKLIHGFHREVIPGYQKMTAAAHDYGVPIFAQLNHNGGQASSMFSRLPVWAPSASALLRACPVVSSRVSKCSRRWRGWLNATPTSTA